ncbi:MAG: putative zinc-binding protein [Methanocorpusculum sp.]|nr:putative zinc-binding protein [Methanocorpusculum sp.]
MPVTLITCSGISNTGKLTTQAALSLMQKRPGDYVWVRAQQNGGVSADEIAEAKRVIVLDGCMDCCGAKKLAEAGFTPDSHLIATELGITKNGMADVQFAEIGKVVAAVLEASR